MCEKLVIDTARIDEKGETFEGEVDCVDINETYVKPFGGVRYRLYVQVFGKEVLAKGHLEQDFDLVCSRCGKDFDTTVKVDDFLASLELGDGGTEVDLTDEVRQSVLLELPAYPVCDEACEGLAEAAEVPQDERWDALDALKDVR